LYNKTRKDPSKTTQDHGGPNTSVCIREAWTMKRADSQKIQTSEMKFLRPVGGYNLLDTKSSTEIRK
jgi:hypothetical protein